MGARPQSDVDTESWSDALLPVLQKSNIFYILTYALTEAKPAKASIPPAKLQAVLQFFQTSLTVHPLKDLEKQLPLASGISPMHIKDALQSLVDDSLIRVEKIGSGNWYWSFVSDERKRLQGTTKVLVEDRDGLRKVIEGLEMTMEAERGRVRNEGGRAGEEVSRLVEEVAKLRRDKEALEIELESYRDGDPMEVERRRKLVEEAKVRVNRNTGKRLVLVDLFCGSMEATNLNERCCLLFTNKFRLSP